MGKINVLSPLVASRIAAGEVIDRPQSVVRELLDNAIDSGANEISLNIENGGIDLITVTDNGEGIDRADLELTVVAHSTSKIQEVDDLYHLNSLGFRGEALYSISAVSRLTIISSYKKEQAYSFTVNNGIKEDIQLSNLQEGTKVSVENLFASIPARRNFLKRASSEALLCKNVFLQKAMSFPSINFTYSISNDIKISLPRRNSLFDRVLDILTLDERLNRNEFTLLEEKTEDYSIYLVTSLPSLYTRDRSKIKIFLNNRNIDEYSFVQAITYGYNDALTAMCYPYSLLFITNNSELVDFNIHPAKREAKIRNTAAIHHSITSLIKKNIKKIENSNIIFNEPVINEISNNKTYFETKTLDDDVSFKTFNNFYASKKTETIDTSWLDKAKTLLANKDTVKQNDVFTTEVKEDFKYLGQLFNLFLLVEKDDSLFIIDQHAAHERLIFEKIKKQPDMQKLLIPLDFEVELDVQNFLLDNLDYYANYGIIICQKEHLLWSLLAVPAVMRSIENEVISLIQTACGNTDEIEASIYSIVACKAAIKKGDSLDRFTAEALLEEIFKLDKKTCPHGRPFIISLNEKELRKMVGRI